MVTLKKVYIGFSELKNIIMTMMIFSQMSFCSSSNAKKALNRVLSILVRLPHFIFITVAYRIYINHYEGGE